MSEPKRSEKSAPLSKADALEILATALAVCTRAGIAVRVGTIPSVDGLAWRASVVLTGVMAEAHDGRAVFTVRGEEPPAPVTVPEPEPVA